MLVTRRRERDLPIAVPLSIAIAWAAALAAQAAGRADLLHHDALLEGGLHVRAALLLFLLGWQVMLAAMMLPSSLPMVRLFTRLSATQRQAGRAQAAFVAGYAVVWTQFGALAFIADSLLHEAVRAVDWLALRPHLLSGLVLVLAGGFQFTDLKDRCLDTCRNPGAFLLPRYRHGVREAYRIGRSHGLFCLGCCWALMLLMFASGAADLRWMAALGALMVYEKVGRHGPAAAKVAGVMLLIWAGVAFADPAWLP